MEDILQEFLSQLTDEQKTQFYAMFTNEEGDVVVDENSLVQGIDELSNIFDDPALIERAQSLKQAALDEQNRQANVEIFSDAISTGVETLKSLDDLRDARRQISESQADLNASQKPAQVQDARRVGQLPAEVRRRLQAISPAGISAQTEGARADIAQNYRADINNAAIAAGGQAGGFQSNAQLASQNRLRGALSLQNMQDQIRAQRTGELDRAMGMQMQENQAADFQDRFRFDRGLSQYNLEQEQAGRALASGRLNRRFALTNLGRNLGNYLGRAMDYGSQNPSGFGKMNTNQLSKSMIDFSDPASLVNYDPRNPNFYNTTQSNMRFTA